MPEKKYLIDTNIYANYLKKNQHHQIVSFIKGLNEDEFLVSSFVLLELFTFYRSSPKGVKQPTLEPRITKLLLLDKKINYKGNKGLYAQYYPTQ